MIPSWRSNKQLADRHKLAVLVMEEGSVPAIARRVGCSKASVKSALIFHGLAERDVLKKL
ncbi:MAG TPA: hypothetical protein O0X48_03280 [Methanocorpusculum sp.]|nr:hypothetical protein [Methanocorpusculum sp.]MBR5451244.1 hypothetical protein [Methanocorpusculum sp.]HJJ65314.1 hypothetical protein [Methanocorpusculum sp.]